MKKRNIISLMLVAVMAVSGSVPGLVHAATDAAGNSQEDIIIQEVNGPAVQAVSVDATVASEFSVSVPKTIQLNGATKSAAYKVSCSGDFPANKKVTVVPDSEFMLRSVNKANVKASVSQNKTEWLYDDNAEGSGTITANGISAGSWNGVFNFNITFEDTECDADKHEWTYETIQEEKQVLVKEAWDETVKEAWDESIKDTAYICNGCGKMFSLSEYGSSSNAKAAHTAHVYVDKCSGGYHTDEFTTTIHHDAEIIHHDAEYKTETIQRNVSRTCSKCNKFEDLTK